MEQPFILKSDSSSSICHFQVLQRSYGGTRGDLPRLQWAAPPAEKAGAEGQPGRPGHRDDHHRGRGLGLPAPAPGAQHLRQEAAQEAAGTGALPGQIWSRGRRLEIEIRCELNRKHCHQSSFLIHQCNTFSKLPLVNVLYFVSCLPIPGEKVSRISANFSHPRTWTNTIEN